MKDKKLKETIYTLDDILKAIDFDKYIYEYGNIVAVKPQQEIDNFLNSLIRK